MERMLTFTEWAEKNGHNVHTAPDGRKSIAGGDFALIAAYNTYKKEYAAWRRLQENERLTRLEGLKKK